MRMRFTRSKPHPVITSNELLFDLRDRGRIISIPTTGERIYEMDGNRYRCFLVSMKERFPGEGPWRAEILEARSTGDGRL